MKSRSWTVGLVLSLLCVGLLAGCGSTVQSDTAQQTTGGAPQAPGVAVAPPQAPGAAVAPPPAQGATEPARSAVASPSPTTVGTTVTVRGSSWPPGQLVTSSLCGNLALNGSADCDPKASGQTVATSRGDLVLQLVVSLPPKPCPCVVRTVSLGDSQAVDAPFEIVGAPQSTPTKTVTRRTVEANARIVGSGPLLALLGGTAKREVVIQVTNTGNEPLLNPELNLAFGKGEDPTEPVVGADGAPVSLGTLNPGQLVELRVPLEISPIPFGSYRLKGSFVGLDSVAVDGVTKGQGDLTFFASTSAYPWLLIVVAWLVLQIPLLGLYKRRPVSVDSLDEDPLYDELPMAGAAPGFAGGIFEEAAVPAAVGAGIVGAGILASSSAPMYSAPASDGPPPPPGYLSVGPVQPVMPVPAANVATPAALPAQPVVPPMVQPVVQPIPQPSPQAAAMGVQPLPPMPPASTPAVAPIVASPVANPPEPGPSAPSAVFGVNDLRSMMQQPAAELPPTPPAAETQLSPLPTAQPGASPAPGVDALRSLLQPPTQQ